MAAGNLTRAALAGNPNSGKTTLFNRLTGGSQYVGNWPGVTVEKKAGALHWQKRRMELVDLPGVYALSPYSPEERIAGGFLQDEADVIINIVDADNPVRNLYLTVQLLELGKPMAVAFNMADVLERRGDRLDCRAFERMTGVPAVAVSAAKQTGLAALCGTVFAQAEERPRPRPRLYAPPEPACADPEGVLAQRRYDAAEALARACIRRAPRPARSASDRIDCIATHRVFAIPLFFLIAAAVFAVTFGPPGAFLTGLVESMLGAARGRVGSLLEAVNASDWARSLMLDGVLAGMGAVLQFLPQILLLFCLLALLEDSGYMARVAFILDAPMRRIGLSGRSFVPLFMGFGCTVPAVMGTRILEREKDRRLTVFILPFMSCSAKMPVYALFLGAFFPGKAMAAIALLYLCGAGMAVFTAFLFHRTLLRGAREAFVMELPPYRAPSPRSVWTRVRERLADFVRRAGTVLLCASLAVWLLRSFTPSLQYTGDGSQSLLAALGGLLAPVFTLCGFADWRPAVALLTGLVAKESVVSTMSVLYGGNLTQALQACFTPCSAAAFLLFVLLYTPCAAALAAIRREQGSMRWALGSAVWQMAAAWYVSALFYQLSLLAGHLAGLWGA